MSVPRAKCFLVLPPLAALALLCAQPSSADAVSAVARIEAKCDQPAPDARSEATIVLMQCHWMNTSKPPRVPCSCGDVSNSSSNLFDGAPISVPAVVVTCRSAAGQNK